MTMVLSMIVIIQCVIVTMKGESDYDYDTFLTMTMIMTMITKDVILTMKGEGDYDYDNGFVYDCDN